MAEVWLVLVDGKAYSAFPTERRADAEAMRLIAGEPPGYWAALPYDNGQCWIGLKSETIRVLPMKVGE